MLSHPKTKGKKRKETSPARLYRFLRSASRLCELLLHEKDRKQKQITLGTSGNKSILHHNVIDFGPIEEYENQSYKLLKGRKLIHATCLDNQVRCTATVSSRVYAYRLIKH